MISYKFLPKMLVQSDKIFLREPVDKICNKIIKGDSNRIILTGGENVGKTVVLHNLQNRGVGTEEQTIYVQFAKYANLGNIMTEKINEPFFNHYYEYMFSNKLIYYLKDKYPFAYYNYFKKIENKRIKEYENTVAFQVIAAKKSNNTIKHPLSQFELSEEILNRMKKVLEIEKINLAIDDFDIMSNVSKDVQEYISKYFDMFDKVIIGTHDTNLDRKKLKENGYSIEKLNYIKRRKYLEQIITRRILEYDMEQRTKGEYTGLLFKFFSSPEAIDVYMNSGADVDVIFDTILVLNEEFQYKTPNYNDLEKELVLSKEFKDNIYYKNNTPAKLYL